MREEMLTYRYGNSDAPVILIQMVGDHELPGIENEIREIHRLTDQEFAFVAVKVENWNQDLSPWKAPAVFGKEEFGDGAARTLKEVLNICTDRNENTVLEGIRWQDSLPCGQPCRQTVSKVLQQHPPRSGFRDSWKI